MKKVAIVEDEEDILELVSLHLIKAGFNTEKFLNGKDFLKYLEDQVPDFVVLDLMLPDSDGIEICKFMRTSEKFKSIPILILTARTSEADVILGLELGADDYLKKPFSPRELVARVKAIMRRGKLQEEYKYIKIGNILKIDPQKHEVIVQDKKIDLTATEFKILKALAEKKGWVFSREKLLEILWGDEKIVVERTIDVHIRHLREKLGPAGNFIKNIRGVGYKIEE